MSIVDTIKEVAIETAADLAVAGVRKVIDEFHEREPSAAEKLDMAKRAVLEVAASLPPEQLAPFLTDVGMMRADEIANRANDLKFGKAP